MFIFVFACRMKQPKPKQTFLFCVLTCMMHDFLEEMCVAGGTVLFLFLHVSGRRQFKRGTCDV